MDEIICPDCGRPNLSEAEKCWYCQVPLVKNDSDTGSADQSPDTAAVKSSNESPTVKTPAGDDSAEDLPDWLKRVRELKKADQPPEENNEWQQQKLFAGQAEDTEESADQPEFLRRISKSHAEPDPKPVIPEGQPLLEEAPSVVEEPAAGNESADFESSQSDDELPDGFTPLKTEND
jgi:hypothetical protein